MTFPITISTNYKTQSSDTAIASELALFNLWRSWNVLQRATHRRDILGILKLQQSQLDFAYLQQWANILQLSEKLEQVLIQSS